MINETYFNNTAAEIHITKILAVACIQFSHRKNK